MLFLALFVLVVIECIDAQPPLGSSCNSVAPQYREQCLKERRGEPQPLLGSSCNSVAPQYREQCLKERRGGH